MSKFLGRFYELCVNYFSRKIEKRLYFFGIMLCYLIHMSSGIKNNKILFCLTFTLAYIVYCYYLLQLKEGGYKIWGSVSLVVLLNELT